MRSINQIGPMVLEKKSFEWFLPYMGMTGHLEFRIMAVLAKLRSLILKLSFSLLLVLFSTLPKNQADGDK